MFDWIFLVAAFAGGVFGAAVGAIPAFIMCGFAAIIGAAITMATGDGSFMGTVAWGPLLGPNVAFAGGVAAAAYAAKKGKLDGGKNILVALAGLDSPDVLLVGGAFGALGYLLTWLFNMVPNIGGTGWTNTVALSIVVSAIIVRFMFGKTGLLGTVPASYSRWLHTDKGGWIPYQSKPGQLIVIALGFGIPAAYIAQLFPESVGLVFGISAASLIFLQFGTNVPVTHHITLSATMVAAMTGDLWWGVTFALLGAFLGEMSSCVFTNYADTHIDPPASALTGTFLLAALFSAAGLFALSGIASVLFAALVAALGYGLMIWLQKSPQQAVLAVGD